MSHFIIYSEGDNFPEENIKELEKAMNGFVVSDISLAIEFVFTDEEEIRRLNKEMRDIDKITDVLSFPALNEIKGKEIKGSQFQFDIDEQGNLFIGSVVVCVKKAEEQAREYGHSYNRELHYLLVHGILHCLGYDHIKEEDKVEMRQKEEYILNKMGISREE